MASSGVWTTNWEGIKNQRLCGFVKAGWDTIFDQNGTLISSYGGGMPLNNYGNTNTPSNAHPIVIIFGTGTATPTVSDVALGAKWDTNISRVSVENGSLSYDDTTHTATRTVKATVQNTGTLPVTITEWGISGVSSHNPVLLYRALLDEPVTLNQHESATLTVTISMQLTNPI